ncbi:MAG: hypothetical protein J0I21_19090 [Alphaproteobacteria bacterium]|nr:hypothetical protein [Alphaproteobacteria bacterium]
MRKTPARVIGVQRGDIDRVHLGIGEQRVVAVDEVGARKFGCGRRGRRTAARHRDEPTVRGMGQRGRELARDANVGLTEAEAEVTRLESPRQRVYWNASSFGYTVLGKGRSYYLSSGGAESNATAKADLAKMIPSLPME